ncbi:MAG: DUF7689 domain-containing protein [Candidatus Binataceae bacterium]
MSDEEAQEIRERIKGWFPKLADNWKLTSSFDPRYNCLAFAVGDTQRWWEYGATDELGVRTHWPNGLTESEKLSDWIAALKTLRFELADDGSVEPGYEKLALYRKKETATHAARQLSTGRWTSKLGRFEDIEHDTPDELTGNSLEAYGAIAQFMKRRLP